MTLDTIFTHASSAMTVISLATFLGILWWAYSKKRFGDFETAAHIPFDDECVDSRRNGNNDNNAAAEEGGRHV
jgi:cytochrome c oxidase cbb3-type subunit 4